MNSRPTVGTDRTGSLSVRVDAEGRVHGVSITRLDGELRRVPGLVTAFRQALAAGQSAGRPEPSPTDRPLTARRVVMPPRRSLRDIIAAVPEDRRGRPVGSATVLRRAEGRSANECVAVVLDPAGPGGDLTVDQGWLSTAVPTNVAKAITEAFDSAYQESEPR